MNRRERRRAQRWLRGIVDALGPTRYHLRLLPPTADAEDGAPKGAGELTLFLRAAGLQPDSLVVVDGRRDTTDSTCLANLAARARK